MITSNQYDTPWKEALEHYLPEFFAFFFPPIAREIDWARGYTFLDTELQQIVRDAELGRRLADKLVQVVRRSGEPIWVLVHIEVQSQEEPEFARRMLTYHYRLLDRYDRPVVSLAVLGDEQATWRPDAVQLGLWGCRLTFQFPIVKLQDYTERQAALMADRNPFATVVLAHLAAQATRRQPELRKATKFALTRRLYEAGYARQDVLELFRFIDWLLQLPAELEQAFWQEMTAYEEAQRMTYITTVERRGIEIGRAEGEAIGRAEGLRAGIALALELKFGEQGLALIPTLAQISDLTQLEALLAQLRTAATIEEIPLARRAED